MIVSIQPINNEVGVINYIRYLYGNSKGAAVAGQEFASGILYQGSDTYYSSEDVVGEGLPINNGSIEGSLAWKPILKGSIKIPVAYTKGTTQAQGYIVDRRDTSANATGTTGKLAVIDALSSNAVEGVLADTSTVNYTSGAVKVDFASGVTLTDSTLTSVLVDYKYDNRQVGNGAIGTNQLQVPEVNIRIDTMPVVCQSRKLKALYAFDAA